MSKAGFARHATGGLAERIDALGPWFHNLRLDGIETAPDHPLGDYPRFKWAGFAHVVPEDLTDTTVLDIGCNAGFYALEMARRGARVTAIDSDPRYLAQAELAADVLGGALRHPITFRQMSVHDVAALGRRFDLVIFMGVFYHLRHPLLALDLIREHVAGGRMLFQSMQRGAADVFTPPPDADFDDRSSFGRADHPLLYFIEGRYAGDPTNWFVPNRAGMEAMLRSAGFRIAAHPEPEVYLCDTAPRGEGVEPPPAIAPR